MDNQCDAKSLRSRMLELRQPALQELVRLLTSSNFILISEEQIVAVGEYHVIEIEGETFFSVPFSTGKEVEAVLRIAWRMGRVRVRQELIKFSYEWVELKKILGDD